MDTGAFDTLLAATDPFNDPRNAVGIDIAAGLARLHIMINEVAKTELGLAKHEFTEKYAAFCSSFCVEYTMIGTSAQDQLDRAIRQDMPLDVVTDINSMVAQALERATVEQDQNQKKLVPLSEGDLGGLANPDQLESDSEELDQLEKSLFKRRKRLTNKASGSTDSGYVDRSVPKAAPRRRARKQRTSRGSDSD